MLFANIILHIFVVFDIVVVVVVIASHLSRGFISQDFHEGYVTSVNRRNRKAKLTNFLLGVGWGSIKKRLGMGMGVSKYSQFWGSRNCLVGFSVRFKKCLSLINPLPLCFWRAEGGKNKGNNSAGSLFNPTRS